MSNITMDYRASSPPTFPLSPTKQENPMSPGEVEEEGLPLYRSSLSDQDQLPASSHDELHSHIPCLPARNARPDEIRDFLAYLLVKQRGFSQDRARDVAARWTVGSGLELRQYSPSMFFEVFGREDGWVLFREVRVALWREKRFIVRYKIYFFTLFAVVWETVMITLLVTETGSEGMILFALFSAIFGAIACVAVFIMLCLGTSAEKTIERELREACAKTILE